MSTKQSYPMSILFITVAVSAMLMAMGLGNIDGPIQFGIDTGMVIVCGLACGLLGGIIGLHSCQRWNRMWGGAAVGMLVGLIIGPLMFVRSGDVENIARLQIGGSAGLILYAVLFRLGSADPLWKLPSELEKSKTATSPFE